MSKKHYYAVKVGRKQGIYKAWDECQKQVEGFPRAVFKGFSCYSDAERWLLGSSGFNQALLREERKKPKKRKGTKRYPWFNPHTITTNGKQDNLYSGAIPPWDFPGEFVKCCPEEWEEPINRNAPGYVNG